MNQQPSVITRWLSGTHNFTLDTLSDIEEVLGRSGAPVHLLAIHAPDQNDLIINA